MEDCMTLHENKNLFEEVLTAASQPVEQGGMGISMRFLEKDYWVTRALRNLSHSKFVEQAVFKGGTSLSKACGVGYRFSEDIDIAITSDSGRTDNQTKTMVSGIGKVMSAGLEEVQMPDTHKFSKYRKAYYRYPLVVPGKESGTIKQGVIQLEIVSFSSPYPFQKRKISPIISSFLLIHGHEDMVKQYGLIEFEVNVLDLGRTATEKLVSLIRQSLGNDYMEGLRSKIRHFYDLHYLLQNTECMKYLNSNCFAMDFGRLLAEDQIRFVEPIGWQMRTLEESPLVRDFDSVWTSLQQVYENELSDLAYRPLPNSKAVAASFKTILGLMPHNITHLKKM